MTLDDIAELVKEGNEVQVIDSQSGEDITKIILIQVIWEGEKNKQDILPTSFLHMLIKYGNKIAKDFFENYFVMMLQPYLSFQNKMGGKTNPWKDFGWPPPGLNMPMPGMFNEDNSAKSPTDASDQGVPEEQNQGARGEQSGVPSASDLDLLQQKVKELEKKFEMIDKSENKAKK